MFGLTGEADQVPHDEEVGGEAHVPDDAELVVEALDHLRGQRGAVALPCALVGEVAQIRQRPLLVGLAAEPVRHRELGQARLAELDLHVGPLGDEQRVVACLGDVAEEVAHLGRRLEVVLGALELEAVGVGEEGAGLHAQEGVVRHRVLAVGVVAVVGGQERRVDPAGDLDQLRIRPVLVGDPVVLQLDEEVVPPEDVLQPGRLLLGPVDVTGQQRLEHHPAQAPRGGDQPGVVALEELPVDPRACSSSPRGTPPRTAA